MAKKTSNEMKDRLVADLADLAGSFSITKNGTVQPEEDFRKFQHLLEIFKPMFWHHNPDRKNKLKVARCNIDEPETEIFPGEGWAKIFERLKKEERASYSEFLKEVDLVISKKQETLPLQQFSFIFPINVNFVKRISNKIGEDDFEIIPYETFRSEFRDIDDEIKKAGSNQNPNVLNYLKEQKKICNANFSYFMITTLARQYSFAVDDMTTEMNSILALLIFAKRKTQAPHHQLWPIKMSTLEQSWMFIFKEKNYLTAAYPRGKTFSEQDFSVKAFPFSPPAYFENVEAETFDFLDQRLDLYDKIIRSDIGEIFNKALRSYYEASVANRLDHSVFYYWLTLESLIKIRRMKNPEITDILKNVMAGDPYLELMADTLARIRNGFAHEGVMEVESPTRDFAKNFCDSLIDWFLLKFGKQFSNKAELFKIYTFIQEDNESLRTDKKLIDIILNIRPDD
jgi:hypothetical protein